MSNPEQIYKDAEKKMNSFSLFGGNSKYDAAADMFNRAGNLFKNDKNCMLISCLLRVDVMMILAIY